ncbi:MAG: hypothetical protein ACEQSU_02620 [Microgenomates group bacterium]|jgi:hypothetical protein
MDDPAIEKSVKQAKAARALTRDERLKVALKANVSRRKAQAKARSAQDGNENNDDNTDE